MAFAERDYLKEELGLFIEQTKSLEKEKASVLQELEEKRETDEFKSLEEEFRKEHEVKLLIWLQSVLLGCFMTQISRYCLFIYVVL